MLIWITFFTILGSLLLHITVDYIRDKMELGLFTSLLMAYFIGSCISAILIYFLPDLLQKIFLGILGLCLFPVLFIKYEKWH